MTPTAYQRLRFATAMLLFGMLAGPLAALAQAELCHLHVVLNPPDAVVTINGDIQSGSPIVVTDLKPGVHLLRARKSGYRELRKTLDLRAGQRVILELALEPLTGLVLVHSDPAEADILVDGAHRGKTPALLSDLPFGKYRLQLQKTGYRPREADLTVESRIPRRISFSLTSDTATLRIGSSPPGATLRINGLDRGTTPVRIPNIPEGQATVEMSMDGYHPYRDTVRLAAGQDLELAVTLEPIPATLTVVSLPPKARIYINDEFRGEAPVTLDSLPPGSYRLRAELAGYEIVARTITLDRAAKTTEEFRLPGNVGALEIVTVPPGIRVYVDGQLAGTTEGEGERSRPLRLDGIPMGKREVALRARDRHERRFHVEIERGETARVQHELQRKFVPDYEVRTRTGTLRGVLVEIKAGAVRMEISPGIFRTIPPGEIRGHRPLPRGNDS